MPDHDVPPPNTFAPNEPMMDVFRSRTDLVETLNRYRENLRWYVEERNRLTEEVRAFRTEQQARIENRANSVLGLAQDDPKILEAAAAYLRKWGK